jgi:hypothetical protein
MRGQAGKGRRPLEAPSRSLDSTFEESSAVGGALGVDGEAHPVDGDMVVVPAQGCQVVGVMVAAVLSFPDVVGLEPISA